MQVGFKLGSVKGVPIWRGRWRAPRRALCAWLKSGLCAGLGVGLLALPAAAQPVASPAAATAPWFTPADAQRLDERVQALLKDSFVTAVQYALVDADGVRHVRTVGRLRAEGDTPANDSTLMRQGSVSKSVTALAIARLVEQGRLRWDTPLAQLAPDVVFSNPWEKTQPVTLLHLVEHSAGWDDVPYAEYAFSQRNHAVADYARKPTTDRRSHWPPGLAFRYANGGPAVAGYVIEKVTGMGFDAAMQELVFKPLGMSQAAFATTDEREARTTASYTRKGAAEESPWHMGIRPSGSLAATAGDMAAFVSLFTRRGLAPDGTRLLSEAAVQRMGQGESTLLARSGVSATYAKGQFHYIAGGRLWYGHWGKTDGFRAAWGYLPQHGRGFMLTVNALDGKTRSALLNLLAETAASGLTKDVPAPDAAGVAPLQAASGWYINRSPDREMAALPLAVARPLYVQVDTAANRVLVGASPGDAQATRYVAVGSGRLALEHIAEPTAALVLHEGRWVYLAGALHERVAAWQVWGVRGLLAAVLLLTALCVLWLPLWLWKAAHTGLGVGGVGPRLMPLVGGLAAVALVAAIVPGLLLASDGAAFARAGNPTPWSWGVFAISWLLPLAGLLSALAGWRAAQQRKAVRLFAIVAGLLLLGLSAYFAQYGWIGIRTWRD